MKHSIQFYLPTILYAFVVVILAFFIVFNANFMFGDQAQFLTTTALGHYLPISRYIIPELGRFFPLGITDYNILLLFCNTPSATAHYAINLICFLITAILLFLLCMNILKDYGNWSPTIAAITSLFLLSRVYSLFLDLIFPERLMTLMIIAFVFFAWRFWQTEHMGHLLAALFATTYCTYCKEPMFGALLVFCTTMLCLQRNLSVRKKLFLLLILVNSFIYILLYYLLVYRHIGTAYDGSHGETNIWNTYFHMIYSQKNLLIAIPLLIYRIYALVVKNDRNNLFFDGLIFSGFAYFGACLLLGLNFTYYYFPAVCLITPAILYFLSYYVKPHWTLSVLSLLFIFYFAKLPKAIMDSQISRRTTYAKVENLVTDYKNGYEIVWQECAEEDYENILCHWRKASLLAYFNYITKDEQYTFSDEPHQDKYILLSNAPHNSNWCFNISLEKFED